MPEKTPFSSLALKFFLPKSEFYNIKWDFSILIFEKGCQRPPMPHGLGSLFMLVLAHISSLITGNHRKKVYLTFKIDKNQLFG